MLKSSVPTVLEEDLPDFEILSVLGTGSTSTVYKASQLSLGRVVAIKRFSPDMPTKAVDLAKRFRREAAIWGQLHHENLVHVYDFRTTKNAQYIILEYCEGLSLREIMDISVRIPPDVTLSILFQVFSAVEYIHGHGIVHRDLKPANIFITHDGMAKLLDFGISISSEMDPITLPGSVIGTPAYMSPEQAVGKRAESSSDIFSLGSLMYEMLEGRKPFGSHKLNELVKEIAHARHRRMSLTTPRALRNFINKCLKKAPKDRYRQVAQMRQWCEKMLQKERISSPKNHIKAYLIDKKLYRPPQQSQIFPQDMPKAAMEGPLATAFGDLQTLVHQDALSETARTSHIPALLVLLSLIVIAGFLFGEHPFSPWANDLKDTLHTYLGQAMAKLLPRLQEFYLLLSGR